MPRTKLIGYAPDMDPMTPGVVTSCSSAIPSLKGMRGAPGALNSSYAALAAACAGGAVVRKVNDTIRLFAGTTTALYEGSAGSWTDQTRASGGSYAVGSGLRWRFAQYGDVTIAVNKADLPQFSTTAKFADITAPKASMVECLGQFVFLADTNDGTYSDQPDRIWWCASGDYTDWTPSVTTECGTARLIGSTGPIKALRRFGEQIIVYKSRSMHIGTYQGAPDIWRFEEVPVSVGALSQECVVNVGTDTDPRHIFMGAEDFYSFDGSRPVPIGAGWVKESVYNELSQNVAYSCIGVHDRIGSRIYFYYPSGQSASLDKCVVYNYKTKQWGRDDRQIECAVDYVSPGLTYTELGTFYSTYDDLPVFPYDTSFFSVGSGTVAIFNTSHKLQTLNGPSLTSMITLGDIGDEQAFWLLNRVRPLFLTKPTSSTMTNYYRNNLGESLTTGDNISYSDGKYDVLRSARWHRVRLDFVGDWEMSHLNVYAVPEGEQ